MWSEARLVIAAIALFLGGIPPIFLILPGTALTALMLKVCWLISGAASLYLIYRWFNIRHNLFGKKDSKDMFAFLVMVISGINLGLTGVTGNNIGMSIWSGRIIFLVVGILYLWTAYY